EGRSETRETQSGTGEMPLKIVEAGAHDGQLARDILTWLKAHRPELFHRLEYGIIEPSGRRRGWQQEILKDFRGKVKWVSEIGELKSTLQSSETILFSNELL